LRKVAAAALAVPVLAVIYLPVLARRSIAARLALVGTVGIVVAVAAIGLAQPAPIGAAPPAPPITAVPDAAFRSIALRADLRAGVPIEFSEPMDPVSVAASLSLEPQADVTLDWSDGGRTLIVRPADHWAPGSYQVVTVEPGALAASGRPMSSAVRAAFVTRPLTTGRIDATWLSHDVASVRTAFRLTFDRAVATTAVQAALRVAPAVAGTVRAVSTGPGPAERSATTFLFTPASALAPGRSYRLSLVGLADLDGAAVAAQDLAVATTRAPSVVRFRPKDGNTKVDRHATLSVRFSTAMNQAATRAAFRVTIHGKPIPGSIRFAEGNTVLVYKSARPLPANVTLVMRVAATARSARGVALATAAAATVHTAQAARTASTGTTTTHRSGGSSGSSGGSGSGSAVGGGSWGAVETYYLRLMNCTRTGGWVTSTGSCSSPGGRNVAPLRLDAGISSHVSRPYAKRLAVNNLCNHFIGGTPGDRLRAAGYTSYRWAENLGCRSGNPYSAVLGSHLYFQSEKPYNGGHYVNMMNSAYDRCGIGVWVSSGRVRLVIDFYHPR
jgi:uncharacterized protein YkwD